MKKPQNRILSFFIILTVFAAQFSSISNGTLEASAASQVETVPANPSAFGIDISNVRINGGSNTANLAPGSPFSLSLDYSIVEQDPSCPACIDQIVIGYSDASHPDACAYNGIPQNIRGTGRCRQPVREVDAGIISWSEPGE